MRIVHSKLASGRIIGLPRGKDRSPAVRRVAVDKSRLHSLTPELVKKGHNA